MVGTGDWKFRPVASALPGWIISNGSTIGDASSGASQRANADCAFAFAYLWNNFSNTQCPVSTGRGANAAADFAAHKTIATFNMQATGVIGVDGMGGSATGLLANVPVVSGSATLAGSILGENLHALITAELAQHSHGITDPGHNHTVQAISGAGGNPINSGGGGIQGTTTITSTTSATGITINSAGSGTAHNNVQRSALVYWYMKL
jgi:hypothetical protein